MKTIATRTMVGVFAVAALALAGCVSGVPRSGGSSRPDLPGTPGIGRAPGAPDLVAARFRSGCRFSHRGPDDPIVHPGMSGMSHSHDFFANTSTSADSTLESLRAASTRCRDRGDTAAYWVPTLYDNGVVVTPAFSTAYYLTGRKDHTAIQAFPAGLKIVAGNAKATAPQPLIVTGWDCGVTGNEVSQSSVPTCPEQTLRLRVSFPDCWNGTDLDSTDHKSHMAYSRRGTCPASHPVPVPRLVLFVRYPIVGGSGVTLASGTSNTAHADFFNAWDQSVLEAHVRECINSGIDCTKPQR